MDASTVPTVEVAHHATPKIAPAGPAAGDGREQGWVVVKTSAWGDRGDGGDGGGGGGGTTKTGWGRDDGVPTPDPALLAEVAPPHENPTTSKLADPLEPGPDQGSPTTLKWSYPKGEPTPDPALLANPDQGSPTTLKWSYPKGEPTPYPTLLANSDQGSPTTLKWSYPKGEPTPYPALLANPDQGSPTTLKWNYPKGVPTPDPALLAKPVPDKIDWGYPPGVPTPDPDLLRVVQTPDPSDVPTPRQVETRLTPAPVTPAPMTMAPAVITKWNMGKPTPTPATSEPTPRPTPEPVNPEPSRTILRTPKNPRPRRARGPSPKPTRRPYTGQYGSNVYTDNSEPDPVSQTVPYRAPGGMVIPQQPCGCCSCNGCCNGGMSNGAMLNFYVPQILPQMAPMMFQGGGMLPMQAPLAAEGQMPLAVGGQTPHSCPWQCLINETVATMGRSNEDDAIYELFYTNPLNCCGTIVELGVEDGMEHSTSYFFEKGMNWTTILVEADPIAYGLISKHRVGDKVTAINGAFCKQGPFLYFDPGSHSFSSLAEEEFSSEILDQTFEIDNSTMKVNCVRLDHVLAGIGHINVMVVRLKGDPWVALRTMDWSINVDIWVILMEEREGLLHGTLRSALKLHDYVAAAWDIRLWCETPTNCMENEVWLRKDFNPLYKPLLGHLKG